MHKNQTTTDSIKDFIIQTVEKQNPETASQLIKLVQQTYNLPEKEIKNLLMQLEAEDKIHFTPKEGLAPASFVAYIFSSRSAWYWTTIIVAVATVIAVFAIPVDAYPLVYIRNVLGVLFVLFLPGYAVIKALFPAKVPIKTSSESLDTIERVALSVGMSLALTPIMGLILNYTPIGIGLIPITLGLLTLTAIFASAAIAREYQTKTDIISTKTRTNP